MVRDKATLLPIRARCATEVARRATSVAAGVAVVAAACGTAIILAACGSAAAPGEPPGTPVGPPVPVGASAMTPASGGASAATAAFDAPDALGGILPCPTAVVTDAWGVDPDLGTWQVYESADDGFRIRYPATWLVEDQAFDGDGVARAMFRPPDVNDWLWSVSVHPRDGERVERAIAEAGSQFAGDRLETRAPIVVGGAEGTRVTVVTCQVEGWYYEIVTADSGDRTYGVANGAVRDQAFEIFLSTLEFLP